MYSSLSLSRCLKTSLAETGKDVTTAAFLTLLLRRRQKNTSQLPVLCVCCVCVFVCKHMPSQREQTSENDSFLHVVGRRVWILQLGCLYSRQRLTSPCSKPDSLDVHQPQRQCIPTLTKQCMQLLCVQLCVCAQFPVRRGDYKLLLSLPDTPQLDVTTRLLKIKSLPYSPPS